MPVTLTDFSKINHVRSQAISCSGKPKFLNIVKFFFHFSKSMIFYIVTTPEKLAKGIAKIGYWKASLLKLRQRYITPFPDLIIYLHIDCQHAKHLESLLKIKFQDARIIGEGGQRSEWICCNIEKLAALASSFADDLKRFTETDCEAIVVKATESSTPQKPERNRKRKQAGLESVDTEVNRKAAKVGMTFETPFEFASDTKSRLGDPNVREAFVKYIMSLQDPLHIILSKRTATIFVELLTRTHTRLKNGDKTSFPISIKEAAEFLQCETQDLTRVITGRNAHTSKTAREFTYEVDFITNGRGNPHKRLQSKNRSQYFFFMTAQALH
jgi:hypothetical protein